MSFLNFKKPAFDVCERNSFDGEVLTVKFISWRFLWE
jgi:hypothetical protein